MGYARCRWRQISGTGGAIKACLTKHSNFDKR
jgi:hypothetical protein